MIAVMRGEHDYLCAAIRVAMQQVLFALSFAAMMVHCYTTPYLIGSANQREVMMLATLTLAAGFEMMRSTGALSGAAPVTVPF